ncbi:hypothetical protein WG906_08610 [Pedobacter sp. P351]|uniref:hypothetical protein n=1 Tax=Pedobacter superstes TaxID=3133441 RepID=UPI00309E380F
MNKFSYAQPGESTQPEVHHFKNFRVSYQEYDGSVLHGFVKQVTFYDYEVYVQEKGVIIHCIKDENGLLTCALNSNRNPPWVDGISKEIAKRILV